MNEIVLQARITRAPGMCDQWGVDLTAGCAHDCGYCHFHKHQSLGLRLENDGRPVAPRLALDELLRLPEYPPSLYLSPFTDPLAANAIDGLERLLRRVLPLSVKMALSTKVSCRAASFASSPTFPSRSSCSSA
ncbi:MAG: hypothetical protein U0793_14640 [Gemmataceae bacterium]